MKRELERERDMKRELERKMKGESGGEREKVKEKKMLFKQSEQSSFRFVIVSGCVFSAFVYKMLLFHQS